MTNPSVTYTFTNGSAADATQVNQNFTDLINAMTDGTKTFNIDALTCAGSATFNGAVTLGNATSDDVTITGYVAADVLAKTTNTYDLGAAGRVWAEVHATTHYATTIEAISTAGVAIKGATDGSSAGAGYIGEIVSWSASSGVSITGSNTDFGNGSSTGVISLTKGLWLTFVTVFGTISDSTSYMPMTIYTKSGTATITHVSPLKMAATDDNSTELFREACLVAFVNVSADALLTVKNSDLTGATVSGAGVERGSAIRLR